MSESKVARLMPLLPGTGIALEGGAPYRERQAISLQYETDPEPIKSILPDCYKPTDKPVVRVSFAYSDGVDFMAGRGYRIGSISLPARFDGERDHVEGNYQVVLYEDDTFPIIAGRELLGIPKLYGDISLKVMPNGVTRSEVSVWGHLLFGIEVEANVKQPESVLEVMNKQPGAPMLGYKYIHAVDGPPDASYPIATPSDASTREVWTGVKGRIFYGDPDVSDVALHKPILDALKTLRVKKIVGVSRVFGSSVLRADLARRLG